MEKIKQTGLINDPRSAEQKEKDYKYEDLAMGDIPLNWINYGEKVLKSYPIQNQDGSLSCVSQGTSKILAIHELKEGRPYTQLCPKFLYDQRENYPEGGMWLPNALNIACKQGTCKESLLPCDMKGETFMNDKSLITESMIDDAQTYKGKAYFEITNRSIDNIAQVLEQGYGVLLGFRFDYNEWTDVPMVNPNSKRGLGHGVAGIDYILYKGSKAIIMEDSWGPSYGKGGMRIITEEFLNARCFYAGYITSLEDVKFIFTKTLKKGMQKCLDVKMLQIKLGLIADGIFGKDTKVAVIAFQLSHSLVGDGIVGKITNIELNK